MDLSTDLWFRFDGSVRQEEQHRPVSIEESILVLIVDRLLCQTSSFFVLTGPVRIFFPFFVWMCPSEGEQHRRGISNTVVSVVFFSCLILFFLWTCLQSLHFLYGSVHQEQHPRASVGGYRVSWLVVLMEPSTD